VADVIGGGAPARNSSIDTEFKAFAKRNLA